MTEKTTRELSLETSGTENRGATQLRITVHCLSVYLSDSPTLVNSITLSVPLFVRPTILSKILFFLQNSFYVNFFLCFSNLNKLLVVNNFVLGLVVFCAINNSSQETLFFKDITLYINNLKLFCAIVYWITCKLKLDSNGCTFIDRIPW